MYQAIYKCRLCGEIVEGNAVFDQETAISYITDAVLGNYNPMVCKPRMLEWHKCNNGSMGITDFQGYKKVDD